MRNLKAFQSNKEIYCFYSSWCRRRHEQITTGEEVSLCINSFQLFHLCFWWFLKLVIVDIFSSQKGKKSMFYPTLHTIKMLFFFFPKGYCVRPSMVAHSFNLSTLNREAGDFLGVQGQAGLYT